MPDIPVKIMMNVGTPDQAFAFSRLPHRGIGLARLEFIINRQIGIHPRALLELERDPRHRSLDDGLRGEIEELIAAYPGPREFFVQRVAEGVSMLAAAFAPYPVIVRMSDFKSNEYANLLAGPALRAGRGEPDDRLPRRLAVPLRRVRRLLRDGVRGAAARARRHGADQRLGDDPVRPHVGGGEGVIDLLGEHGLERGKNDLKVVMMCEVPSNAVIADQFLEHFDGFSIGSNDMTQLTLGLDRDSALVAGGFDERDPAVLHMLELAIKACKKRGQVRRHLRPGPLRPPRPRRVAARAGHRVDVPQPRHRRRHLAPAGRPEGRLDLGAGCWSPRVPGETDDLALQHPRSSGKG